MKNIYVIAGISFRRLCAGKIPRNPMNRIANIEEKKILGFIFNQEIATAQPFHKTFAMSLAIDVEEELNFRLYDHITFGSWITACCF